MSSGEAIVAIDDVTYRYPAQEAPALRDVDLCLEAGLTLLVGDSGSGKSTLLRLFDGLVPQFHGGRISGRARVAGLDPLRDPVPRLAQRAGLVFQDVETQSVYGTVEREIAFGLENLGLPRARMQERVDEALARLGIEALRGRRLATLSGGERQRVALAAVLVLRPALIAMDEPISQLDPEGVAAVRSACLELAAGGHAVVVAEHRFDGLAEAAGQILRMEAGRPAGARPPDPPDLPVNRMRGGGSLEVAWELKDVSVGPAGEAILSELDLAGGRGEVVAVVGANGSGKTTLLRTIAGLLDPLSGEVRRPEGRTAYLPQNPAALLHLPTVRDEIALTLRRGGAAEAPDGLLRAMGLEALADRYPRDLSSGQRQRAAIAATIAGSPSLVLLDEPTRGMDSAARKSLAAAVRSLTAAGSAVVLATHDEGLVAELADRVVALGEGRAVEQAPASPAAGAVLAGVAR